METIKQVTKIMYQLYNSNSDATKRTKKWIKQNKTQKYPILNVVKVEDSDEDTPFIYDEIPFNQKKL